MKSARRGTLLLETVTALGAGSVVLLLSVGLIHHSMHWSRQLQSRSNMQRTLEQLARQWRIDSHAAQRAESTSEQQFVFRGAAGLEITYRTQGSEVTRMESRADTSPGGIARKERYALDKSCSVHFEQLDAPKRSALEVRRAMVERDQWKIELRVESLVGRWIVDGGGP